MLLTRKMRELHVGQKIDQKYLPYLSVMALSLFQIEREDGPIINKLINPKSVCNMLPLELNASLTNLLMLPEIKLLSHNCVLLFLRLCHHFHG